MAHFIGEPGDPSVTAAWEYVSEHHIQLRRWVCRGMGRRDDLVDEAFADIIPRAVCGAMRTYDSSKGSLEGHVKRAVRCHTLKWWYCWRKYHHKHPSIDVLSEDPQDCGMGDPDDRVEVLDLLERLHPYYRGIVVMYHMMDMTFEEIGDVIEVSKGTARNHYLVAMEALREDRA